MVYITEVNERINSVTGEVFHTLTLESEPYIAVSKAGNQYFNTNRASFPAPFSKERCQAMVGMSMKGRIDKVPCAPRDVTIAATGEVVTLTHEYVYQAEENAPVPSAKSTTQAAPKATESVVEGEDFE